MNWLALPHCLLVFSHSGAPSRQKSSKPHRVLSPPSLSLSSLPLQFMTHSPLQVHVQQRKSLSLSLSICHCHSIVTRLAVASPPPPTTAPTPSQAGASFNALPLCHAVPASLCIATSTSSGSLATPHFSRSSLTSQTAGRWVCIAGCS